MKATVLPGFSRNRTLTLAFALGLLNVDPTGHLKAQAPCPGVEPLAAGLFRPSKIIQTSQGYFMVAEGGPETLVALKLP